MEIPLTPLEFARRTRRLHPDREAVVDGQLRWTYEQFFDRCDRWSAALEGMGVGKGDRVAYIAPNTHGQLESFYAVPQLGAVLVPINYRLSAEDIVYIVNHSGSTVVCVHADQLDVVDQVRDRMPEVEHFVALEGARADWEDYEALLARASSEFTRPAIAETDLLSINYTSGTTARPKGVMITHRNAYLNVVGTLLHLRIGLGERYLWTLPMFHANGWTYTWTVTAAAATHVCLRAVDPARVFELIRTEGVSWLCAAPTVLIALAHAAPEVRGSVPPGVHVVTAGASPAAATLERLEQEFGWEVTHVYGLTETTPFITVCEPRAEHEGLPAQQRSILKARQGIELITSGELKVAGDHGSEVPWDGATVGEIVVRGNVVMQGYFRDPEATEQVMGDGWFHTGDAAVTHPDGYVEIRDRIKDVIISGGENISSIEVEGVLLRHPAVQEAAIVGLPHEKWGETPHAFIVLQAGDSATADDIISFTRQHLAHFKAPTAVSFVDELPKTATGKIQKYVLRGGTSAVSRQ
ncbi:long-chain-fatty-acid--CoA ligase [Haloactinomyces albus]|uniref:Fatty-acyl-CoA synthase n=1 Tax=Haloactinomyces albus TaxID=1352928 RepID=A0AAE3ZIL4_9ACTN|nr:long-chain-fatty-acid--CoA ligase [Haloactinomyces albus]MDR7304283.1 fatty-acyl-CoA synthase [Haloactinomyces albus]